VGAASALQVKRRTFDEMEKPRLRQKIAAQCSQSCVLRLVEGFNY